MYVTCSAAVAGALFALSPAADAQDCAPGFVPNPYNSQCLSPVTTPTINGVPCVPSNLGLCQSFVQNKQPPRKPGSFAS
ncbi:MAG TPA: hypothetical protein PKK01_16130 [Mycobacterium sp.]|nr:hypothetical protein [Mycobacterium sp.]